MSFANLKIGFRLASGFAVVFLFLIIVAFTGWSSLSQTKQHADVIVHERNVKMKLANDMRLNLNIVARAVRDYLIYPDKEMQSLQMRQIENARKQVDDAIEKSIPLLRSEETRKAMSDMKAQRETMKPEFNNFISLVNAGKLDDAKEALRTKVGESQRKWFDLIDSYIQILEKQNEEAVAEMNHDYAMAVTVLIGSLAGALVLGAWMAWWVSKSITTPIGEAVAIAETVASGDLTSRIEVSRTDEAGQLLLALKKMNESLVNIVSEVRSGTDTIATASNQIASGNMDLSSRTEQQASSLEETASSMEELTSTVKQNADNARQANTLARSASDVASKGGNVVSEVVATMDSINESARKIVDIIGVIDGIAFQTNILALNAAVEAARAGEQGRGFAVVAAEVRNLAQRSATAAKEIKALIDNSVENVESGSRLVNQAGATMYEIVESVKRVTDVIGEITAASAEQISGIEQINTAIAQMDETTQQNASLVEEAAAAAQSMQDQAGNLAQLVSVFKLNSMQSASGSAGAAPRKASLATPVRRVTPLAAKPKRSPATSLATAQPPAKAECARTLASSGGDWEEF
ncbi:MAG TPA: methyl-accepting chemotaxis protein [Noviherbaspirillum sp.]